MKRFQTPLLQETFTKALATARARGADLFTEDGGARRVGSMAVAFWNGHDGKRRGPMEPQGSMASAMFAAGRAFKREASRSTRSRITYAVILTRQHASVGERTTVYGPYRSFKRAEGDAKAWEAEGGLSCTVEPLRRPA